MKKIVVFLMSMMFALGGMASAETPERVQTTDWQKTWNETLAAAKKEGKVVVVGPPDTELRVKLPAAFKARYGITLEYISGPSSAAAAKLRAERSAGVYTVDAAIAGIQTMSTIYHREKMLDPLKPTLILPEVVDPSKWKAGKLWFMDPEQQYVLRLFNDVAEAFAINTREVKPGELRSMQDLLDPKWKGKIALMDPTVSGTGSNTMALLYVHLGEEFVKRLLIDQKPMISRERRQLTDALVRGTHPIAFGAEAGALDRLQKDGFPILQVYSLPGLPGAVSGGNQIALLSHAPHPNAARIFLNWMATKEGSEIYGRALGMVPLRTDIDELSFLEPGQIPRPGVTYFDTYGWEFTVTKKEAIRLWVKKLLEAR